MSRVLSIQRCDSLAWAGEIKALFERNGRPEFVQFFDRAYPLAAAAGGSSWLVRDASGAVVQHIAIFPRLFRHPTGKWRGGLLVDLMSDARHRNFFTAAQLCRQMVADVRASAEFDFLYTDPTPPAVGVLKAAGFRLVGTLRRFVLPLGRLYLLVQRLRCGVRRLTVEHASGRGDLERTHVLEALRACPYFRAERSMALYASREPADGMIEWLVARVPGAGGQPAALAALDPNPRRRVLTCLDLLWDHQRVATQSILHALARSAHERGFRRLGLWTLADSRFAAMARGCGFLPRSDVLPVLLLEVGGGTTVLPPMEEWLLMHIDGSAW